MVPRGSQSERSAKACKVDSCRHRRRHRRRRQLRARIRRGRLGCCCCGWLLLWLLLLWLLLLWPLLLWLLLLLLWRLLKLLLLGVCIQTVECSADAGQRERLNSKPAKPKKLAIVAQVLDLNHFSIIKQLQRLIQELGIDASARQKIPEAERDAGAHGRPPRTRTAAHDQATSSGKQPR